MKVLLIDPAGSQRYLTHNAGLAFLSSALLARGHEVRVLDLNNYEYTDDEAAQYARTFKPDWIGASVKTALVRSAERTLKAIRTRWESARTIIGGPHVGVLGAGYMAGQDLYEFGLAGEGERALLDLIDAKNPESIPGLIFYSGGRWISNRVDFDDGLDTLAYPTYRAWDRIDRSLFPYPMVHSRGCPYQCSFCSVPKINGKRFRKRSPEGVVEELRFARREYVFRDFEFIDDNFTLDIDHAKRVCEALIRADLGVGWFANNGIRADRLDRELAVLMKKSGCKGVALGIESADEEILENIHKGETIYEISQGIRLLRAAEISVGGHFIIGLPGDTLEKAKKIIQFKESVGLDYAYFNQLVPYPGTEVGEWAQHHAKILVDDLTDARHFGSTQIIMETPEFPKKDRELLMRMLATDYSQGTLGFEDFKTLYGNGDPLKVLVIRSGRMDPYDHIRSLLPENSVIDVLVSKGIQMHNPHVRKVYEFPNPGLMRFSSLATSTKKKIFKSYDLVIYINTLQTGLSFENIVGIANNCADKVYEYQAGKQFRRITPGIGDKSRVLSIAS
jgi:anaerobic magnesium-protoporphyrin IX monomethyl ester cyclase